MKVKDQDGNVSRTYEVGITKIDKEPPTKPVIVLHKNNSGGTVISSGTWVNTNVSQEQKSTDSLSGIKGYERSLDMKKWTSMGVNAIESKEQEQHYGEFLVAEYLRIYIWVPYGSHPVNVYQ